MISQTPDYSYVSSEPFFDKTEEENEKKQYYNDLWRKSVEERQKRPLTIQEYEKWYEIAANCEMNSELQYVNYIRDYNETYKECRLLDNGNHHNDEPEKTLTMPSLMCTKDQLFSKISAMTLQCNTLKEENENYKTLLNNFQTNYAYSPIRQPISNNICPARPEKKTTNKKTVQFSHETPKKLKGLFPIKTVRNVKTSPDSTIKTSSLKRYHSFRYVEDNYNNSNELHPQSHFYKASELLKKLDNPLSDIMSEKA